MWNQRSVDTFLGLPFNIASYGTLLQLIADECDMIAGELIGNLGDVHYTKTTSNKQKNKLVENLISYQLSNYRM
jgi:thymidylate synthase